MEVYALKEDLREMVSRLGGDLFGVASFQDVADKISEEYGDTYRDLDRAVSIAVFFPKAVLNELADGPTHTYLNYYDAINVRLNDISLRVSNLLQRKGYKTFPIPASQRVNESKLAGIFSHRLAAHRAGMGWIGKNCSLINPEVGPRLRLATILTNAPLPADKPMEEGRCGNCTACWEACPPQAIKGVHYRLGDPLDMRLDAQSCHDYLSKVRQSFGKRICGRCLAVCPWGK